MNKPVVIDEVATTSVWYEWNYSFEKSRNEYLNHNERKDNWIHQLWEFLVNHPEIVAAVYFNTDYTHGLEYKVVWEADWAIVNTETNKVYWGFQELETFSEKNLDNILINIFHLKNFSIEWENVIIPNDCTTDITRISAIVNEKSATKEEKLALIDKLKNVDVNSDCIKLSLNILSDIYNRK